MKLSNNSKLSVFREKARFAIYRKFSVFVDGAKKAKLGSGDKESFPLNPGEHSVFIKIDWMKSNRVNFQLNEGEEVELVVEVVSLIGLKYYSNLIFFCLFIALAVSMPPWSLIGLLISSYFYCKNTSLHLYRMK